MLSRIRIPGIIVSAIVCVSVGIGTWLFLVRCADAVCSKSSVPAGEVSHLAPVLIPWQCVGGCGAGGSGGGSLGVKWVGEGVSGGLVEIEFLPTFNFGKNFGFLTIPPRVSFKLPRNFTLGVTMPLSSKFAEFQYRSNRPSQTEVTGGLGDISLNLSKLFGSQGQFNFLFNLTMPTGQYDIKRGTANEFLPKNLQMGAGIYSAMIGLAFTKDVDKGLWLFDANFSYPFNMKPYSGENEFLNSYFSIYKNQRDNERFYYHFKPYGENDLGDHTPPSVSGSAVFAYRGVPSYVHSFGLAFSVPLGVAWIHSESSGKYDPRPDPDHQAWMALLSYGLEFSKPKYPVFFAIALPLHDKSAGFQEKEYDPAPMRRWNAPDWSDILKQWTFALGFKSAMF